MLRLYVAGQTPKSVLAFTNLKKICEEHLKGHYRIEIVDLLEIRNSQAATRSWHCPPSCGNSPNRSRRSSAISPTRNACLSDWICARASDAVMLLKPDDLCATLEQAARAPGDERYILRLYVAGLTTRSSRAVSNLKDICDKYLEGRYDLDVIDIYQQPGLTRGEQIVAAPTLIKKLPLPIRRIIGDMSNRDRVLVGLDLVRASDDVGDR